MQNITRDGLYSSQMVNTLATEEAFSNDFKKSLVLGFTFSLDVKYQIKTATS